MDALAPIVFDVVQLIVRGKNFYFVMSCKKKKEQPKETETYLLLLTDSQ